MLDAIYMVVITVYGVGYGEVQTVTHPGLKVFTIGVIVAGCTSAVYVFGGFVQFLVEGELNRYVGARRMKSEIARLKEHVIVCGFGRVGQILCRELHANQHPFVVVETQPERIDLAKSHGYLTVQGNATEEITLTEAGIDRAESLAAVLSDDVINVFVTLTAKELRSELTIFARAENPATEKKLQTSGASQIVLPASIGARRIAESILSLHQERTQPTRQPTTTLPTVSSLERIGFLFQTCLIRGSLNGLTMQQLEARIPERFLTLELEQTDGTKIQRPPHSHRLLEGDKLLLLGPAGIAETFARLADEQKPLMYRGARR